MTEILPILPEWARGPEAVAAISAIIACPPAKSRVKNRTMEGWSGDCGYSGGNAGTLRFFHGRYCDQLIEAGRSDDFLAALRDDSDALIDRVLERVGKAAPR